MPRKDFVHDLQEASSTAELINLQNVRPGEDDGAIACTFSPHGEQEEPVDLQLLVSDLSDYPREHDYFLYTTSEGVHHDITACLEKVQARLRGLRVTDMLVHLSNALKKARSLQLGNIAASADSSDALEETENDVEMVDADSLDDYEQEDDEDEDEDEDDWSPDSPFGIGSNLGPIKENDLQADNVSALVQSLACDLKTAKAAGFRVGYLGNEANPIVCISCRISRLGISEEAMGAWKVDGRQYLVCLIRYIGRYQRLDQIMQEDAALGKASVQFLVDLCDSYKPTIHSAHAALHDHPKNPDIHALDGGADHAHDNAGAREIIRSFISKPLNSLMNERFVKILRYRHMYGFCWEGGESFFNDTQGKALGHSDPGDPKYSMQEKETTTALPKLVTSDHLLESKGTDASFPLIAMQFALRHFVRCTEFCLVCHCKTDNAFEALKPYVCSKNLCLYQYMSLGFGPSLEWEILSQPTVVDLLISFTYSSAKNNRLKDFPVGLGFFVPVGVPGPVPKVPDYQQRGVMYPSQPSKPPESREVNAKMNRATMELLFPKDSNRCLRSGDWIAVTKYARDKTLLHCRVHDVSFWPTVKLGPPVRVSRELSKGHKKSPADAFEDASFVIYDKNFDDLDEMDRRASMCLLLDTLPSVTDMKSYLSNFSSTSQPNLSTWKDRISKSALDVLRWIVASNRSCIIQDDPDKEASHISDSTPPETASDAAGMTADRVGGVRGYMQFRFAQGAPDKEQRFIQSVVASSSSPGFPTIFAWHGSPLHNWHGILREGLHYKEALHGRAYGDGVYMSLDFSTSLGYARGFYGSGWPQSKLDITSAISLNEVVNAPSKFVSTSPHLVVTQLDWIQTRYLFVSFKKSPGIGHACPVQKQTSFYYQQDPKHTAYGPDGSQLFIPMSVFSRRRRLALEENGHQFAAAVDGSQNVGTNGPLTFAPDGWISDDTDEEDRGILDKDYEHKGKAVNRNSPTPSESIPKTDFVSGKLDGSKLPLLGPPQYATPGATKSLQRDLITTLAVQEESPLHELGWYIDPDLISTVYQWIVELHSFEAGLPLAGDLKHAGLTSIVLELRFAKDYPISPPFVRVIRPRFLGFQQGGGGHVTAGGALCMELLTNSGWSAVSSIESVLLQVRMAMSSTEPRPARLERGQNVANGTVRDYGVSEAVDAYIRACQMHGWEVPKDFRRHMGATGWSAKAN